MEREFNEEEQDTVPGKVREGTLTTQHSASVDGAPVLVEDETGRVYTSWDLPPATILFVEAVPGFMPPMAMRARDAGFIIEHAEKGPPDIDVAAQ
jgi:hypothetical protein